MTYYEHKLDSCKNSVFVFVCSTLATVPDYHEHRDLPLREKSINSPHHFVARMLQLNAAQ